MKKPIGNVTAGNQCSALDKTFSVRRKIVKVRGD